MPGRRRLAPASGGRARRSRSGRRTSACAGRSAHAPRREKGSGTVLAVGLTGVLCSLIIAAVTLLGVVTAVHRAAAAADLAALAGAQALASGQGGASVACERAGAIARAYGAGLAECSPRGEEIRVRVETPMGWVPPGLPRVAHGVARAGPAPGGG